MGKIPAQNKMVSTVLIFPKHNDVIEGFKTFNISLRINNLQAGFFTNATSTYYSAPQDLNGNGQVIGHTHVTVQDLGNSLNPQQPLDASVFTFFKGINDAGNGNGLLQATVTGGLPDGFYRVCTMSGASNHQPVLMPVAQRGTQEDCNKFEVKGGTAPPPSSSTTAAAAASTNKNDNKGGDNKGNNKSESASATASAAATESSAATGRGKKGNGKGKFGGGNNGNNNAAAASSAVSSATKVESISCSRSLRRRSSHSVIRGTRVQVDEQKPNHLALRLRRCKLTDSHRIVEGVYED